MTHHLSASTSRGEILNHGPSFARHQMRDPQQRRQHMLNWQFEPLLCCLRSKSLTCITHAGPTVGPQEPFPSAASA